MKLGNKWSKLNENRYQKCNTLNWTSTDRGIKEQNINLMDQSRTDWDYLFLVKKATKCGIPVGIVCITFTWLFAEGRRKKGVVLEILRMTAMWFETILCWLHRGFSARYMCTQGCPFFVRKRWKSYRPERASNMKYTKRLFSLLFNLLVSLRKKAFCLFFFFLLYDNE